MTLISLPSDILILVLRLLSLQDLASVSGSCRLLHTLVRDYGWSAYLRNHPRPSFSLSKVRAHWNPQTQLYYDTQTDQAWSKSNFMARPLSRPWAGKRQPVLAISPSRLIVGAGPNIYSYKFGDSVKGETPAILAEGVGYAARIGNNAHITSMSFVDDGGLDQTLCIGFDDGTLERVVMSFSSPPTSSSTVVIYSRFPLPRSNDGDIIESLSSEGNILLSLSASGCATLTNVEKPSITPHVTELKTRSWVSHLCLDSSGPYAVFGTSSISPLSVYSVRNDHFSSRPSAVLHTKSSEEPIADGKQSYTAVYGVARAPPASPWGASPQILVSGWFDGQVRCYDLRSSSRATSLTGGSAPLRPVMSLCDPWSNEPIYSVSCGGGSASHIAAGSARHGVVSFWDTRSPKTGWSVHAPGNDPSPVYSVILESSRLYGATQSRSFIYDFGPQISSGTYPALPDGHGIDGLKRKKGSIGIGFYVTKYSHNGQLVIER